MSVWRRFQRREDETPTRYSPASVTDKASAEALLMQMRPELEAAGLTVLDVSKGTIQIQNNQGDAIWVDVIRGASAGDPAFQWHDLPSGGLT